MSTLWQATAENQTIQLKGKHNPGRQTAKFDHILVVDDVPSYAQASLEVLRRFYADVDLTVHISHSFASALAAFQQFDIKLVILDLDLDDAQGDGDVLLERFRLLKPAIVVLANSSERKYNEILLQGGAVAALNKDVACLQQWLAKHG